MAFGVKVWTAIAVVVCALIALAYLPPEPVESSLRRSREVLTGAELELERTQDAYWQARWRLRAAYEYKLLLERHDSLTEEIGRQWDEGNGDPVVLVDRGLSPAIQQVTDSLVEQLWRGTQPTVSEQLPVAVAILVDTLDESTALPTRSTRYASTTHYVLPNDERETCLTVVSFGAQMVLVLRDDSLPRGMASRGIQPGTVPTLLGPCAYYAAFGRPGLHIGAWLERAGHAPALLPNWTGDPPYRDRVRAWRRVRGISLAHRTADLVPCAAGALDRCRSALFRAPQHRLRVDYTDIRPGGTAEAAGPGWRRSLHLGVAQESYLSDLILDLGRDRFGVFWRSDAPVDVAFADAFGITLDEWTMQWAQRQIGVPRRGPAPPTGSVLMALALSGVMVMLGVVLGRGREVT